jgi:WD40 repeat protein
VGQTPDATSDIVGVAWSPTGDRVAGIAKNGSLVLWQPNNQNFERVISGHRQPGLSIAWSTDGVLATGGQDGNIIFWDTNNWRPDGAPLEASDFGWVQSLSFSSDGYYLASGSDDQMVKVWDAAQRTLVGDPLPDHEDTVRSVDFDPRRGEYLLASAGLDNNVFLHEIATIQGLGSDAGRADDSILSMAETPQGRLRVATLAGNQVSVSEGTGEEQIALNQFLAGAGTVALSPDGTLIAIGDEDGSVRVYEVDSGQELAGSAGTSGQITGLAFSQDSSQLAVLQCGKVIQTENGTPACEYNEVSLLDSRSGESIEQILLDSPGFRRAVAIQPGGSFLAVGDDSGYVSLYNTTQQIWTSMATKLPAGVASLAFSPDGSMLASGNTDKSLQLWDVSARQPIARAMFGAPDVITGLVFEPATGNLFTGSRNGAVQYWLVSPSEWEALNCELAGRNFTLTEWEQFFPGVDPRETCPGY